ncbi:hypothetical protein DL769_010231 [Monosporascus sp. CRB-8-3]|nr:hypothetical protein DL769_010231 [Monosporascus sp. CRB-8-3]
MSSQDTARGTKSYRRTSYPAGDPTQPELSTKGKSAVVTGAGQGIGASIARSLARSGDLGPGADGGDAVKAAFATFAAEVEGRAIDILVANAGYMANLATIADADPKDWQSGEAWFNFSVHACHIIRLIAPTDHSTTTAVKGNFHLMRAYVQQAPTDGSGAVIHVAASSVHGPYILNFSSYRASKAGATKLSELFAHGNPA